MKMLIFENAKLVAEAVAVFGILLLFWRHPAMQKARGQLSRFHPVIIAVAALFVVEATAQITTRDQYKYPQKHEPFPFTRWAMFAGFTHSLDSASLYDWRGITAAGQPVEINPAHLFLTTNAVVLFSKTHALGDQLPLDNQPADPAVTRALDAFAEGILVRHNQLHPQQQVIRIELWKRTLPLQPGTVVPAAFAVPGSKRVYTCSPDQP
ncbi:hypothetical protein [Prosthecobacter sp.]|uniref:hypothetical protein n=1 Tax=Prosthecobacter sp. TaxID=1965333 RepID=UPI003784E021